LPKRHELGANPVIFLREGRGKTIGNSVHIRLRLLQRHARLEAGDSVNAQPRRTILERGVLPLPDRGVDIAGAKNAGQVETCRQHADDREGTAIQR